MSEKQLSLLSILSAEDSPAKTSQSPDEEKESQGAGPDSGKNTLASSRKSGRNSSSSKTCRRSLREGWTSLSKTLNGSLTACLLESSKPPTLARLIVESDSSSWPTATATDSKGSVRHGYMKKGHSGTTLTDAIREWPTPAASSYGTSNNGNPGDGRGEYATKGKPSLETMARTWGGWLNPDWVETLMGFPVSWSDGPLDPETLLLFGSLDEQPR